MKKEIVLLAMDSSLLAAGGYDDETQTLRLQFKPSKKQVEAGEQGPMFDYSPVPVDFAKGLMLLHTYGGSVGKFFLAEIKPQFKGEPVADIAAPDEAAA